MRRLLILLCCFFLTACGFKPQGEMQLALPLHRLYLATPDTYGTLEKNLRDSLKMSGTKLVSSQNEADTLLVITSDSTTQELLSVSSTQQTRQYTLRVAVSFYLATAQGRLILPEETISDSRTITIQLSQILGSSNEAAIYYQQMRRYIANAILNRLASKQATLKINKVFYDHGKLSE